MYRSSAFLYVRPPPSDANRTVNNVSVRRTNPAVCGNDVAVHVVVRGNDISVSGAGVAENGEPRSRHGLCQKHPAKSRGRCHGQRISPTAQYVKVSTSLQYSLLLLLKVRLLDQPSSVVQFCTPLLLLRVIELRI